MNIKRIQDELKDAGKQAAIEVRDVSKKRDTVDHLVFEIDGLAGCAQQHQVKVWDFLEKAIEKELEKHKSFLTRCEGDMVGDGLKEVLLIDVIW